MPAISTEVIASAGTDNIKNVSDRLASLGGAAVGASDDVAKAGGSFINLSGTLKSLAPVAKGAGAAFLVMAGAIGQSIAPAMRLEKQMAELAKLTGEKQAQPITASIMEMSNQMPVARKKLMGVAESAARLGIRGTANITKFTEVMGMVGTATNATAIQASEDFARIAAMTQTPIEDIDKLASTANQLSNTAAASFQEVSDSARRAAASLSNLGATAPEILALSTSVTEVSASARRSGTRLRRVAQQLQAIPAADLAKAFEDLSAKGLARMRRNDPTQLILKMAEAFRTGGRSAKILREQLTSASEQALAAMAVSIDQVRENLEAANVEWNDANSLSEEYAQFQDTAAARTAMLKNSIENTRAEMGTEWLPVIKDVMDAIRALSSAMFDLFATPMEKVFPEERAKEMTRQLERALKDRFGEAMKASVVLPPDVIDAEALIEQFMPVLRRLPGDQLDEFSQKWASLVKKFKTSDMTIRELKASLAQMIARLGAASEETEKHLTTSERFNKGMENFKKNLNLTGDELKRFENLETLARDKLKTTELKAFGAAFFQASNNIDTLSGALGSLRTILRGYGVTLTESIDLTKRFEKAMQDMRDRGETTGNEVNRLASTFETIKAQLPTSESDHLRRQFLRLENQGASLDQILKFIRASARSLGAEFDESAESTNRWVQKLMDAKDNIEVFEILVDRFKNQGVMPFERDLQGPAEVITDEEIKKMRERVGLTERQKAIQRAMARVDLTSLQSQMDMIMRTSRDMANTMVTAFNALFDETKDAEEALQSFFTTLSNNLAQRAIQSFLFPLLQRAFLGAEAPWPGAGTGGGTGILGGKGGTGFLPDRQHGGPVSPDTSYLVGEAGPEVFVPDSAGEIVPNDQLGGGGQTVVKVDQNFQLSAIDERGMSEMIQRNKGMIARATIDAVNRSERASKRLNTRGRR